MMPLSLEKRILISAPKEIMYKGKVYPIAVEKSRFADVEYLLKNSPHCCNTEYFGDRDRGEDTLHHFIIGNIIILIEIFIMSIS